MRVALSNIPINGVWMADTFADSSLRRQSLPCLVSPSQGDMVSKDLAFQRQGWSLGSDTQKRVPPLKSDTPGHTKMGGEGCLCAVLVPFERTDRKSSLDHRRREIFPFPFSFCTSRIHFCVLAVHGAIKAYRGVERSSMTSRLRECDRATNDISFFSFSFF